jgi:hypothetical protein
MSFESRLGCLESHSSRWKSVSRSTKLLDPDFLSRSRSSGLPWRENERESRSMGNMNRVEGLGGEVEERREDKERPLGDMEESGKEDRTWAVSRFSMGNEVCILPSCAAMDAGQRK